MTGATGLIGGELLRQLIKNNVQKIYCLVRYDEQQTPIERLAEQIGTNISEAKFLKTVVPVIGDITKPGLGIDENFQLLIKAEVKHIFHCAATTYFLKTINSWETNVGSVVNVTDFVNQFQNEFTLYYFGSAACCGERPNETLLEDQYPTPEANHFVEYTRTKAAAEVLIAQRIDAKKLVIIRPSMVFPDQVYNISFVKEAVWPLLIMKECSALPCKEMAKVDIVPLSFVGEYTMKIAMNSRKYNVYHISAGNRESPTFREIMDLLKKVFLLKADIKCAVGEEWDNLRAIIPRREMILIRRLAVYYPFINQNLTYSNERLVAEFGLIDKDQLKIENYLSELLHLVSLEEALKQSEYEQN